MVTMAVLLCTSNVLQLEHCVEMNDVLVEKGWKGERTMSTFDASMVLLLVVYLHPDSVMRVSREAGAANDPLVVLLMQSNSNPPSVRFHNCFSDHHARMQGLVWAPRECRLW